MAPYQRNWEVIIKPAPNCIDKSMLFQHGDLSAQCLAICFQSQHI